MRRPMPSESAPYYGKYISLVPEEDVLTVLDQGIREMKELLDSIGEAKGGTRYAPDKWSIKEVIGHLIDSERIFGCRALRFGRGDETELPGMNQDVYVAGGKFDRIPLRDLGLEFAAARQANVWMFRGFPEEAWDLQGIANRNPVSVRALAFILAGHDRHHRSVISERYL